jgi:hypothetical protein
VTNSKIEGTFPVSAGATAELLGGGSDSIRMTAADSTGSPPHELFSEIFKLSRLDICSLYVLSIMTDRPTSWRVPTPKLKMEKLAAEVVRRPAAAFVAAPDAPLPAEYWDSVLAPRPMAPR